MRMTGLPPTSNASKAAQGSPTHIVTSNASGDLAVHTLSELGIASGNDVAALKLRDEQLTEGLATVAALAQPILLPGQSFAVRAGWGGYDGANALGFSAAGVLARGVISPGVGSLVADAGVGVGTSAGAVTGRAGLSLGW